MTARCTPGHRIAAGPAGALPPQPPHRPGPAPAPSPFALFQLGRVRFAHGGSTIPLPPPLASRSDVTTPPPLANSDRASLPPSFPTRLAPTNHRPLPHSPEQRRVSGMREALRRAALRGYTG